MHTRRRIAALLLAATSAVAQQPAPGAPRNAALDYWRANALVSKPRPAGEESAFSKIPWDAIGANTDPAKMPPEWGAARAEVSGEAVRAFLTAAQTQFCDFQPHFEEGWSMVLPELASVRNLARMTRVDARDRLMAGDAHGAAERISAMYHAAGHVALENTLISSLVGAAISKGADEEAKVLAASGLLADPDREQILGALRSLKNDGLHIRAALEGERRITSTWIKKEYAGADGPRRFTRDFLGASRENPEAAKKQAEEMARLTPEQFADAAHKTDIYYELMLRAWDGPAPAEGLKALEQRLDKGEFGPIASFLAPAMSRARSSSDKAYASLAAAEEALMKK